MRKRIACVTAAILSISLGVSGCGLIPFEQDIPFLSSRAENAETEKKTEQQTIDEQDADTEKSTEDTQQDDGLNEESRLTTKIQKRQMRNRKILWSRQRLWLYSMIMMAP